MSRCRSHRDRSDRRCLPTVASRRGSSNPDSRATTQRAPSTRCQWPRRAARPAARLDVLHRGRDRRAGLLRPAQGRPRPAAGRARARPAGAVPGSAPEATPARPRRPCAPCGRSGLSGARSGPWGAESSALPAFAAEAATERGSRAPARCRDARLLQSGQRPPARPRPIDGRWSSHAGADRRFAFAQNQSSSAAFRCAREPLSGLNSSRFASRRQ